MAVTWEAQIEVIDYAANKVRLSGTRYVDELADWSGSVEARLDPENLATSKLAAIQALRGKYLHDKQIADGKAALVVSMEADAKAWLEAQEA